VDSIGKDRFYEEIVSISDYVNTGGYEKMVEEHFSGGKDCSYKLWQLIYFCRWMKYNS
jgi:asparagine synthase (glutamine-hydrolysing)